MDDEAVPSEGRPVFRDVDDAAIRYRFFGLALGSLIGCYAAMDLDVSMGRQILVAN